MKRKLKNIIKYIKYNEPNSYIVLDIIMLIILGIGIFTRGNKLPLEPMIIKDGVSLVIIIIFVVVSIRRFTYTKKNSTKYLKVTPSIFGKKAWINQRLSAIKSETAKGLKKDMYSIKEKLLPGTMYYAYTHELIKLNLDRLSKKGIIADYRCEKAKMKTMKKKHVVNLKLSKIKQQFYYISFVFIGIKESK